MRIGTREDFTWEAVIPYGPLPCPYCGGLKLDFDTCESMQSDDPEVKDVYVWCDCGGTGPQGSNRTEAVKAWNTRSIPELPPVSPEDLIEGEWYVVKNRQDHGGKLTVAQCKMETMRFDEIECDMIDCDPYPVLWIVGAEFHFRPERFDSIYGPLRFKIGGAE